MVDIEKIEDSNFDLLKVKGEVDASSSIHLDEAIGGSMENPDKMLLVDLSELDYISSAGLGVFMSYVEDLKELDKSMVLFGLNEKVKRVFEILGLNELLTIAETKEDALKDGL